MELRCRALLSRLPDQAAISHSTAAALWGIPLPSRLESDGPHVTVPVGVRAPQRRDVHGHQRQLPSTDVTRRLGFAVTSPERTWCDLGEQLSFADLVAAGDYLVHGQSPLVTIDDLAQKLDERARQRGSRLAREALPRLSDRAGSGSWSTAH